MKIWSDSFADGAPIPAEFALCVPADEGHVAMAANRNPHLAWDGVPEGTRSLALLCIDTKVPSVGDDVNQEGKTVPADLPRVDFSHWVLVDLPADTRSIAAGSHTDGVTAGGKGPDDAPLGRAGINNYTDWFAGDPDMGGDYYGYDGPAPPWNDSLVHEYEFTVFALDIESVPVSGRFGFQDVRDAIAGHVLAEACIKGTYTLNKDLL